MEAVNIKFKLVLPVLILFSLALFFNVSDVSAATDNQSTVLDQSSQQNTSNSQDVANNESKATPVSPKVTFTTSQISSASVKVKTFVDTNNRLPNYVTISNTKVTMPQFLMLLTDDLKEVNDKSTNPVVLKNVNKPSDPTEDVEAGSLPKSEYLELTEEIAASIDSKGAAPDYIETSLGKISYEKLIYTYSKIMNYYNTNKKLPATVSVKAGSTQTTTNSLTTTQAEGTVDQILKKAAKYGYSSVAHDAAGLIKYGTGDCWAMSDYLFKQFSAAGIKSRVVQYATEYASNHRSVQLYQNGAWVDVPYREYGFNMMFNNTSGSKYGSVIASI